MAINILRWLMVKLVGPYMQSAKTLARLLYDHDGADSRGWAIAHALRATTLIEIANLAKVSLASEIPDRKAKAWAGSPS